MKPHILSVSKLKKRLLQIPLIRNVNVKKTFSGLLRLEIEEYKPLVDDYEKALKPKYLNAYSRNGLILETFESAVKKAKNN